jgi:hypothetical protein
MEEKRNAYRISVEKNKPKGKRSLGIHRHSWEDSIKMDLRVISGFVWLKTGLL